MMRLCSLLAAVAAIVALSCCSGEKHDYSHYVDLPRHGWAYEDTVLFTPDVAPAARGRLSVALRHNGNYPYRNLWLEVSATDTTGRLTLRDTLAIELADRYGLWRGTGVGPLRQVEVEVAPAVSIDSGATVAVRHIMRVDTLRDIEQVGIFIISPDK